MQNIIRIIIWISYALMMIFGLLWVLRETGIISLERPEDLVTPTLAFGIIGFILKNVVRKRS